MPTDPKGITQLLQQSRGGNKAAFDELVPIVYDQLHKMAARCFSAEYPGHTLRATALLNEAYLKLVEADVAWTDRVHFFAVAARVMRRILVDHARGQAREKRGGDVEKISLDQGMEVGAQAPVQLLDLDRALERLSALVEMGNWREAEPYLAENLAICRKAFGERDPGSVSGVDNWARLLQAQGRLRGGREVLPGSLGSAAAGRSA